MRNCKGGGSSACGLASDRRRHQEFAGGGILARCRRRNRPLVLPSPRGGKAPSVWPGTSSPDDGGGWRHQGSIDFGRVPRCRRMVGAISAVGLVVLRKNLFGTKKDFSNDRRSAVVRGRWETASARIWKPSPLPSLKVGWGRDGRSPPQPSFSSLNLP